MAPGDYTSATGSVTFAPGDVSETVTVQTNTDALVEGDETFNVNLSTPTGNAAILDGIGLGTIVDVPVEPVRHIMIGDATATEGDAAMFTVSLDAASVNPITVDFATADGTATAPGDYTSSSGTVTFAAGDTSELVTVPTTEDAVGEPTEMFDVNLSNNTGNSDIVDGLGVGTILDDDIVDKAAEVIVNGPVRAGSTAKTYVLRVTNQGTTTNTIDPATEISAQVLVNGVVNGSVSSLTGPKTLSPGARARFRLRWTGTTPLVAGDLVRFEACVNELGDIDPADNCDFQERTAG
jgi:hypothetical protein